MHAFAKSDRFPKIHTYTANTNPEPKPTDFDLRVKTGRQKERHCFGSRTDRFRFSYTPFTNTKVGPANYSITDIFSPKTYSSKRSARFTFGVSRDQMKKEFVGEAEKESLRSPGPFTYRDPPMFYESSQKASMRPRLVRHGTKDENYSEYHLEQERKRPGPGYYEAMNVVGSRMPNSTFRSYRQNTFSKAEDRFKMPAFNSPPPSKYSPRNGMTEDFDGSKARAPRTKFGQNMLSPCDLEFNMKRAKQQPGPGEYDRYSEFCSKA